MEKSPSVVIDGPWNGNGLDGALEDVVRIRAYQKWVQRGCPPDQQQQDWFDAEAECLLEHQVSECDPTLMCSILTNTTAVIYVKDLEGRYLLINRRYETLFNVRLKWLIGRTDYELFPKEIADVVHANDLQVLAAGAPIEFEEQISHDDGVHTYISLKFPIRNGAGETCAICGISTDISERTRLTRRRAAEHAVTRALAEASNLTEASPAVLQGLCEVLGMEVGVLWVVDGADLHCAGTWSDSAARVAEFERLTWNTAIERGQALPGRAWAERAPVWIADTAFEPGLVRAESLLRVGLRSALATPVREGDEVCGVLEFFGRASPPRDPDLLNMLDAVGRQIGLFIQRRRAEASLRERAMELQLARRIQEGFFPRQLPDLPGLVVAAESQPAQETGGDYVDFVPMAEPALGIAVGDVSGHGVGSALLMALTRAYLRAFALSHREPADIFPRLNRSVAGDMDPDHFVTLFFATLDTARGELVYANAGHLPGYIVGAGGEVRHTLPSTSYPLGLDANGEFTAGRTVQLQPGDLLFVMTDGIIEAFGREGGQYGLARALALVRAWREAPPRRILDELFSDVAAFSAGQPQLDDRSALLLKWRGAATRWDA